MCRYVSSPRRLKWIRLFSVKLSSTREFRHLNRRLLSQAFSAYRLWNWKQKGLAPNFGRSVDRAQLQTKRCCPCTSERRNTGRGNFEADDGLFPLATRLA